MKNSSAPIESSVKSLRSMKTGPQIFLRSIDEWDTSIQKFGLSLLIIIVSCSGFAQFGTEQILTIGDGPRSIHIADMDGDGDMDVLSTIFTEDKVVWSRNIGGGYFNGDQYVITSNGDGPSSVYSADIDGDGDLDALSTFAYDDKAFWHENDGSTYNWEQNGVGINLTNVASIFSADLDGDGDMDVLAASTGAANITWYENDGSGSFFGPNAISTDADESLSVYSVDLDGDGDMDVLSASYLDGKIAWYENDGGGNFGGQNVISTNISGANSVFSEDLDGDGDMDVLSASYLDDKIAWYENDGNGNFGGQNTISTNADGARCVYGGDLDGDGDIDVLSASYLDGKIAWYENDGNGNFGGQNIISTTAEGAWSVRCADLDGDGDKEVISAAFLSDKICWYENFFGGCIDPLACNFNPLQNIDNGSCCYGVCGCLDPESSEYDPSAQCDDGSCEYILKGSVFFDENENGVMDENEYGLPFQEVVVQPGGLIGITNDEGCFVFTGLGYGSYTLTINPAENFSFVTTQNPVGFNVAGGGQEDLIFGVSNEEPDFDLWTDFYSIGNFYPCNDLVGHNICFRNMGNLPMNGIVEVEIDGLFQEYQVVTPIDSVVGSSIFMSFENLLPGQLFFYDIDLHTPTVDFIGEWLTSTARVYGFHNGDEVAYGESILVQEMTCSYDPNDKQVFPNGYTDEHFILNDTELQYLIRFQNTGNASAINVSVTDTIDENLDLDSFTLLAHSHSVQTMIRPEERVIEFFFENIMLPDSSTNEPESHGLISYVITPYPDLESGTEINNTGNIYFDNNPPIITNTTWSTIHECGGEADYSILSEVECEGVKVEISASYEWLDETLWIQEDQELSTDNTLNLTFNELGIYGYTLVASNPLCVETVTFTHEIDELPQLPPCFADFNCDGHRDTIDLLDILFEFGCLSECEKDLNEDGVISVLDLRVFLAVTGQDCE